MALRQQNLNPAAFACVHAALAGARAVTSFADVAVIADRTHAVVVAVAQQRSTGRTHPVIRRDIVRRARPMARRAAGRCMALIRSQLHTAAFAYRHATQTLAMPALAEIAFPAAQAMQMIAGIESVVTGVMPETAADRQVMLALGKNLPAAGAGDACLNEADRHRCISLGNDEPGRLIILMDDLTRRHVPLVKEVTRIGHSREQHAAACGIAGSHIVNPAARTSHKGHLAHGRLSEVRHHRHILTDGEAVYRLPGNQRAIDIPAFKRAAAHGIRLHLRKAAAEIDAAAQHLAGLVVAVRGDAVAGHLVAMQIHAARHRHIVEQQAAGSVRPLFHFIRISRRRNGRHADGQAVTRDNHYLGEADHAGIASADDIELVERTGNRAVTGGDDFHSEALIGRQPDHLLTVAVDGAAHNIAQDHALAADDGRDQLIPAVVDVQIHGAVHAYDAHLLRHVSRERRIREVGILRTQPSHGHLRVVGLEQIRAGKGHHQIQQLRGILGDHRRQDIRQGTDGTHDVRIALRLGQHLAQTRPHLLHTLLKGGQVQLQHRPQNINCVFIVVRRENLAQLLHILRQRTAAIDAEQLAQQPGDVRLHMGVEAVAAFHGAGQGIDGVHQHDRLGQLRIVHQQKLHKGIAAGQEAEPVDLHFQHSGIFGDAISREGRIRILHACDNGRILLLHLEEGLGIMHGGDGRQEMGSLVEAAEIPGRRRHQRHDVVGIDDVMDVAIVRIGVRVHVHGALGRLESVAEQVRRRQRRPTGQAVLSQVSGGHIGHRTAAAVAHNPQLHPASDALRSHIVLQESQHIVPGRGETRMLARRANLDIAAPLAVVAAAAYRQGDDRRIADGLMGRHHADGVHLGDVVPEIVLGKARKADVRQQHTGVDGLVHPRLRIVAGPDRQLQAQRHRRQARIVHPGVAGEVCIAVNIVQRRILVQVEHARIAECAPDNLRRLLRMGMLMKFRRRDRLRQKHQQRQQQRNAPLHPHLHRIPPCI